MQARECFVEFCPVSNNSRTITATVNNFDEKKPLQERGTVRELGHLLLEQPIPQNEQISMRFRDSRMAAVSLRGGDAQKIGCE
jgi:hypothetical protein